MNNRIFLQANKVFTRCQQDNEEKGKDTSKPRKAIDQQDMGHLFKNYFTPGLSTFNAKVLLQKAFFDIVYYTGRRGKEGLCELDKKSFEIKIGADGLEYVQLTFNEKTKKNQGHETSSAQNALHTGRERLIRSHSSAMFCFELSGNSN